MRGHESKMKGNENKRWHLLTLDRGCSHPQLENSHLLSTGSPPPEKTTRVKKKKDSVILRHLNKIPLYRVFIQPHMCLVLFARQFGIPILHGSEKCEKTDQFGSTKCDCTRFKVHHFWGPGLSDECSPRVQWKLKSVSASFGLSMAWLSISGIATLKHTHEDGSKLGNIGYPKNSMLQKTETKQRWFPLFIFFVWTIWSP